MSRELLQQQVDTFNCYVDEHVIPLFVELQSNVEQFKERVLAVLEAGGQVDDREARSFYRDVLQVVQGKILDAMKPQNLSQLLPREDHIVLSALFYIREHRIKNLFQSISGLGGVARSSDVRRSLEASVVQIPDLRVSLDELGIFPKLLKNGVEAGASFVEGEAKAKGVVVDFDIDTSLVVMANHFLIGEVFTELMQNSIRAMEQGGRIHVEAMRVDDEMIKVVVTDDGVGLSAEEGEHAFDEGFTARAEVGGTGKGLALVKAVVEDLFGGSIAIANRYDGHRGAEVTMLLKAA
jgi:signal transduction histidine kinase